MSNGLLYARSYSINDKIQINIPTVRDVLANQDNYNTVITLLTANPYDFMVQLDDAGIDYTDITDYELFIRLVMLLQEVDVSILLPNLNLKEFAMDINPENNSIILVDKDRDIIIDRGVHTRIANAIREINFIERVYKKPGNEEARKYMIERARTKMKRNARKKKNQTMSELEKHIVALVNTEEFKYNFDSVLDLTIFQFNTCLHQIIKKVNYDKLMIGVYSGSVDTKKIDKAELTWLP